MNRPSDKGINNFYFTILLGSVYYYTVRMDCQNILILRRIHFCEPFSRHVIISITVIIIIVFVKIELLTPVVY